MSRLDELIAEYCPDGVEFKNLSMICESLPKKTLKQQQLESNYKIPCCLWYLVRVLDEAYIF